MLSKIMDVIDRIYSNGVIMSSFWLIVVCVIVYNIISSVVDFTNKKVKESMERQEALVFEVYCVSKSGGVLFDETVGNAYVNNGTAIIKKNDTDREAIQITGECRIVPIENKLL